MVEESIDQLKKQRIIEHMEFAITDLQKFGSNPLILNSLAMLHDSLVIEYNELYAPKPDVVEDEKAHPTIAPKKGTEDKVGKKEFN